MVISYLAAVIPDARSAIRIQEQHDIRIWIPGSRLRRAPE